MNTIVTNIDFAVPTGYTIGDRFGSFADAVGHARRKITGIGYPGQKVRPEVPDYHPKRCVQDGDDLVVFTRAFVHMRRVEPVQDRDEGGRSGLDGVIATFEVFNDGTVEELPRS